MADAKSEAKSDAKSGAVRSKSSRGGSMKNLMTSLTKSGIFKTDSEAEKWIQEHVDKAQKAGKGRVFLTTAGEQKRAAFMESMSTEDKQKKKAHDDKKKAELELRRVEQKKTRKPAAAAAVSMTLQGLREFLDEKVDKDLGRDRFLLKYVKLNEKSGKITISKSGLDVLRLLSEPSSSGAAMDAKDTKEATKKTKTGRFVCFRQTEALQKSFEESEKVMPGRVKVVETADGKYFSLGKVVLNAWNEMKSFTKSDWDHAKSFGKDKEPLDLPRWFKEMTRNE
jgi:hypothetical protein